MSVGPPASTSGFRGVLYNAGMEPLGRTATMALRRLIANQPDTDAKVAFAWTIAAGPVLARAASLAWSDGTLRVTARSETWRRELAHAKPVIAARMAEILGAGVVRAIVVRSDDESASARPSSARS